MRYSWTKRTIYVQLIAWEVIHLSNKCWFLAVWKHINDKLVPRCVDKNSRLGPETRRLQTVRVIDVCPGCELINQSTCPLQRHFSSSFPKSHHPFLRWHDANMAARVTFPRDLAGNSATDIGAPDDNSYTSRTSVDLETCDELILWFFALNRK